jgi:cytidyltransferase-like protein
VIVSTDQLIKYRQQVAMVDGGFDPLHPGHIDYFRDAAKLDVPLLCNVSPDDWVQRKHAPLLTQAERGRVIDAIRFVDYVHLSRGTTEEVLRVLRPRYYVKGVDWADKVPRSEVEICTEYEIEIVFLDTVTNSSTGIVERFLERADT